MYCISSLILIVPTSGVLMFDFFVLEQLPANAIPISDSRCFSVMEFFDLSSRRDKSNNISKMKSYRHQAHACLQMNGSHHIHGSRNHAIAVCIASVELSKQLDTRSNEYLNSIENHNKFKMIHNQNKLNGVEANMKDGSIFQESSIVSSFDLSTLHIGSSYVTEHESNSIAEFKVTKEDFMKRVDETRIMELTQEGHWIDQTTEMHPTYKYFKITEHLLEKLSRIWVSAFHVAIICEALSHTMAKTKFGSFRVEFIISIFSRIVDLYNMHIVLAVLTPEEHGCLNLRVGVLNLFNPLVLDEHFAFDLSKYESRLIGKVFAAAGQIESGENWLVLVHNALKIICFYHFVGIIF